MDLNQCKMNNVVGYVSQTPYLIDDTILNNIAFVSLMKTLILQEFIQ